MDIISLLLKEMDAEEVIIRKMFDRVPEDKWDWKPHIKSMHIKSLTVHIAELPGWVTMALTLNGYDFGTNPYQPTPINDKAHLFALLESSLSEAKATLSAAKGENLSEVWTLRSGDHILAVMTRYEVIRHAFAQIIHHRAQLGVYLRLLDIPIAGSYGPSADEM